ncbi:MAG: tetratricopeptide repeat protein [Pirellulales bacterium]|nr:tetratricopeptide repeat protein [Pirellulales bacterium]
MAIDERIEALLAAEKWDAARSLLEQELARAPEDHWLITQLGVVSYEQRKYPAALKQFVRSLEIVADCPLTLWNLAGTLDALGKVERAIPIYAALLRSKKSSADDPCWESPRWTDSLKADCIYRLGVCFQKLGKLKESEAYYRRYLDLLLAGVVGTYTADEVTQEIRLAHASQAKVDLAADARKTFRSAVRGLKASDDMFSLTQALLYSHDNKKLNRLQLRRDRKTGRKRPASSKRGL